MYPKKELAQLVLSACEAYKIETVVISPGSRNAPLTVGFANSKKIKSLSIVDERCAAFFALGIAQQQQKPVAVVCTSGSALLNYYPAVSEAFYSKIPLLIISADRPKHLIDIGDGQTIRQENVYANHILYSANLVEEGHLDENQHKIEIAIQKAYLNKGPVHINVPFDEPLYETVNELKGFKWNFNKLTLEDKPINYGGLIDIWNSSEKKMILVGVNSPSEELQELLDYLIEDEAVLVMTETTSNLYHPKVVNSIDKLISKLTAKEFEALQPDLLITFGGMVVSKRIKKFLRSYSPKHHWHIDEETKMDSYFSLSEYIKERPEVFFKSLKDNFTREITNSNYQSIWISEKENRDQQHNTFFKGIDYSDLMVFNKVLKSVPDNSVLQVSNSSIIRYMQLFTINSTTTVFCNRGTSGIDGSTSTAIGAAYTTNKQTIFITGDVSFFYDSNALWNNYIPSNFRIILLNNDGGGIFKIIPGPKSTNALSYFETSHGLTAEHLAKMHGFDYYKASTIDAVEKTLLNFYNASEKPKILEIFTPSAINDVVLQEYFNSL